MQVSAVPHAASVAAVASPPPAKPPAPKVDSDGDHDHGAPDAKPANGTGAKVDIKA